MRSLLAIALGIWQAGVCEPAQAEGPEEAAAAAPDWSAWRGPLRDGQFAGPKWPERLSGGALQKLWRVPLGPSYSGPIVSGELVFTTETARHTTEVVYALDRRTGDERWRTEWPGAMTVPFFAAANGSWIRATPACDGERLYVAGMRDVLVCLDARTGDEIWRVDFVKDWGTALPSFGFVSSPLLDGDAVYVQAGASCVKLDKQTGDVLWRTLQDEGGMNDSAFSSPTIATLAGQRQLLVQMRETLNGVDLDRGEVKWSQEVPSFRGMNILTPLPIGDAVFTSSYQNGAWLYGVPAAGGAGAVSERWKNNTQAYMSSPVLIDGHIYVHLQNQRFACINAATGERTWTSTPYGKYCSLVAQGDRILALDERGVLLLIRANPESFELIDELTVSESSTWAHLAVSGDELFIRELDGLSAYRWKAGEPATETAPASE